MFMSTRRKSQSKKIVLISQTLYGHKTESSGQNTVYTILEFSEIK